MGLFPNDESDVVVRNTTRMVLPHPFILSLNFASRMRNTIAGMSLQIISLR